MLVLEAGSAHTDDPMTCECNFFFPQYCLSLHAVMPSQYGVHFGNEEYDWAFQTVRPHSLLRASSTNLWSDRLRRSTAITESIHGTGRFRSPRTADKALMRLRSGKGLGGSSAINFYGWIKPPRRDLDGKKAARFPLSPPVSYAFRRHRTVISRRRMELE